MSTDNKPLCIDCDGTLIKTDLLHEAMISAVKLSPVNIFKMPIWLLRGKAHLKKKLSDIVIIDWKTIPYNNDIIHLIENSKKNGRNIVLATASPKKWAIGIAEYIDGFDEIIATEGNLNLKGIKKANKLVTLFGEKGFSYAGDSKSDLEVWEKAHDAIIVTRNASLIRKVDKITKISKIFKPDGIRLKHYIKSLRIYQWLKNMLIFVPVLTSHQYNDTVILAETLKAFISFSLCASAGYAINDLLDINSDRQHFRKKTRPFASGDLPIAHGFVIIPFLLLCSAGIALSIDLNFFCITVFYLFCTLIYSIRLKRQVIVDVVMLAALYTLRIIAGAIASEVIPSFWLLAFSMFIFLSLAVVKRYSELSLTLKNNKQTSAGRGYHIEDLTVLLSIGVSAGMASVLVFALYINDENTIKLYPNTYWLWCIVPILLYWISRIWMKAHRGEVHDDPLVFAVSDWQSRVIFILSAICLFAAIYL